MTSRFWQRSDSEEEDEDVSAEEETSDEDSSSEDEAQQQKKGPSRFMIGSSDSDSDDDKRVVRSAKDRRFDELKATCEEMRNKLNINDWSSVQSLFDKLNKQMEKAQKATESLGAPRVYIKMLVELEDRVNATFVNKELVKKMSPTNNKAFNTMRQRLRKHNPTFADQMEKFRAAPESEEEESEEEEEEESSDEESDEEEGEEGEDGFEKARSAKEKKKDKLLTMDPKEITFEMVNKKLQEIVLSRGKKGIDRQDQVDMLTYLATVAKGPYQKVEVLVHVVSALFDINPSMSTHMVPALWRRCIGVLFEVLELLEANPHIIMDEHYEGNDEMTEEPEAGVDVRVWGNMVAFLERLDDEHFKSLQVIDPHTNQYLDRLKDEPLFLALAQKVSDHFTRIGDTKSLARVALRRMEHFYYKTDAVYDAMRKLAITQQQAANVVQDEAENGDEIPEEDEVVVSKDSVIVTVPADFSLGESCQELMDQLSIVIYKHGDERTKARAMLCSIFFKAIRDDFYTARDMMLMSHLQDNVQHMDISTQILYNRTMAQLGLCAFRAGLISDALAALSELCGSGRVKELLAQGMSISRYQDKTPEQEKLEKRRQMPFHMHINLELLESTHLICAMLQEVSILAVSGMQTHRKPLSKTFRRLLDNYDKQTFTGPPENVRDHVMASTQALMRGDWRKAYEYLAGLTSWNLIPAKENVLAMLKAKLQQEGLRTYLLTYGAFYHSLSQDQLSDMFDLSEKEVHSVVSKMMMDEMLSGSWDQPTRTIVMHATNPTRLQALAEGFAERAAGLVDLNERALTLRTGGLRGEEDDAGPRGPYQDGQYPGNRGGGRGNRGRGLGRPMLGGFDGGAGGRGGRGGRGGMGSRRGGYNNSGFSVFGGGDARFQGGDRFRQKSQSQQYERMTQLGRVTDRRQ
ncbi:Eukaryotic translation initiation factor 3 subunit C [Coccomyxa sp. Obi]|nr:Eukaryotic translation initiation factor 3 subunit C [Coccomyxa sp. Obi]